MPNVTFSVIDKKTGCYPDTEKIALNEKWAEGLCYCDIDGFAIMEDGTLTLLDECGNAAYPPADRFDIIPDIASEGDRIRAMSDEELSNLIAGIMFSTVHPYAEMRKKLLRGEFLDWLREETRD